MKVLINALSARQRGGQTYLINLLTFLPRDGTISVLLLAPASLELGFEHPHIRRYPVPRALENPFVRAAWEKLAMPAVAKRFGAQVLFCPGGVVSSVPACCAVVTMFRNMIPFDAHQRSRYPLGYERLRNWLLHRLMLKSMINADLVIFISQYAKEVVERHAGDAEIRSVVVPHGIAAQFKAQPVEPSGRAHSAVDGRGYFLYVSYLDVYKAQMEVVQAFGLLKKRRPFSEKLLLVGPENPAYGNSVRREIERLGLTDDVVVAGAVPYAKLPELYRGALVIIFASESENCPNILLEAMGAGRPILCSNRPPMPEFAGDAAVYFDPAAPSDLADKLQRLLEAPAELEELGARARSRSALYAWDVTARRTWEAIAHVAAMRTYPDPLEYLPLEKKH
jgi:glycosyltransferase involved in cell wall biosynthesis